MVGATSGISDNLASNSNDDVRMQKMEETLKTDFGLDMSAKDILVFRSTLCSQLTDNRTAVAKQASELVTTLVR